MFQKDIVCQRDKVLGQLQQRNSIQLGILHLWMWNLRGKRSLVNREDKLRRWDLSKFQQDTVSMKKER
jgi:hypothetical protein